MKKGWKESEKGSSSVIENNPAKQKKTIFLQPCFLESQKKEGDKKYPHEIGKDENEW